MNVRVFKKDIDFMIDEFLSDALISLNFSHDEEKENQIMGLVNEAIDLRNDIYHQINHPDKENIKAYFNKLHKDFFSGLDKTYDKLSAVVNSEAKKTAPAKKAE